MTSDDDDPFNNTPCKWPGCSARGNPYEDQGWCWWWRYYLLLPEGFYCPKHTTFIKEGHQNGYFDGWARDMSAEVLEWLEAIAEFVPLDSQDGKRILREAAKIRY